jgi:hypothetical protein
VAYRIPASRKPDRRGRLVLSLRWILNDLRVARFQASEAVAAGAVSSAARSTLIAPAAVPRDEADRTRRVLDFLHNSLPVARAPEVLRDSRQSTWRPRPSWPRSGQTSVFAAMLGLVLLAVLLHGLGLPTEGLGDTSRQLMVFGRGEFHAAFFSALLGALSITSEIRHGTIRATFLISPRRGTSRRKSR